MRKWSFFDSLLGDRRPKSFSKEAHEQIRDHTKMYLLNYGRVKLCSLGDVARWILKSKSYDFNCEKFWRWLGANYGFKGEIAQAVSHLKKQGYPIISGNGHKGYRYADERCENVDEVWEDACRGWSSREENWDKERQVLNKLIDKVIASVKNKKKKEKLIEIKVNYLVNKRR